MKSFRIYIFNSAYKALLSTLWPQSHSCKLPHLLKLSKNQENRNRVANILRFFGHVFSTTIIVNFVWQTDKHNVVIRLWLSVKETTNEVVFDFIDNKKDLNQWDKENDLINRYPMWYVLSWGKS